MANQEQLEILKNGVEGWNKWRKENSGLMIDLTGVTLKGAELRKIDFHRVDLLDANLMEADLREADLSEAHLGAAILSGANLSEANLRSAEFWIADLNKADLSGANLSGADFTEADLSEANLKNANLVEANLREANLTRVDLRGADLTRADLTKADLSGTDLRGADLTGADLTKANLSRADLREANIIRATFQFADLSAANFYRANLFEVDLIGANLKDTNLKNANILANDPELAKEDSDLLDEERVKEGEFVYVGREAESGSKPEEVELPELPEPPKPWQMPSQSDEVSFTAIYPKEGRVETWHTLLVYPHLTSAIEEVRRDAQRFKEQILMPKEITSSSSTRIVRGTEITIIPSCVGLIFNPERVVVKWMENYHRTEFRFWADKSLSNDAARGQINIYGGPIIVGTIKFVMLLNETDIQITRDLEERSRMYHQEDIFVSYSHKDSAVVLTCKKAYEALGFTVLIDADTLRSGQVWNEELMHMIDRATIFQLFWSQNSRQSKYCRQEWEHALKRNKEGLIRPVYWEIPMPDPPEELSKFHFEYVEL